MAEQEETAISKVHDNALRLTHKKRYFIYWRGFKSLPLGQDFTAFIRTPVNGINYAKTLAFKRNAAF